MLKTALFDYVINEKCCSVDRGRGIWQLKSPHLREFAIQGKKNANGLVAAGIDWCITRKFHALWIQMVLLKYQLHKKNPTHSHVRTFITDYQTNTH